MGAAQKKIEDYHKALEYLNRAIELQPDFIHAKALQKLILTKYLKKLLHISNQALLKHLKLK